MMKKVIKGRMWMRTFPKNETIILKSFQADADYVEVDAELIFVKEALPVCRLCKKTPGFGKNEDVGCQDVECAMYGSHFEENTWRKLMGR